MESVCKNTSRSKYRTALTTNSFYHGPIYSRTMIRPNDYSFPRITCPSRESVHMYKRNVDLTRDEAKCTDDRYKRNKLCCVVLTTAIFLVAVAVLTIAGLAFYMGALTTDTTNPLITFTCSMKIIRGDFYTSALKYNYTSAFREKSRRYKYLLETVYQKSLLGPAFVSCAIEKFKNISLTIYFTLNFNRKKIPRSIPNAENTIKEILVNDIQSRKSTFRNIKIDTNSIAVKRYIETDHTSVYQREDISKPKEATQIKNNVVRKPASNPNITLTANIPVKRKQIIEEPEINEEDLPVVQGSFKITKTDADITVKKNLSIKTPIFTTKKITESTTQTTLKTTVSKPATVKNFTLKNPTTRTTVTTTTTTTTAPTTTTTTAPTTTTTHSPITVKIPTATTTTERTEVSPTIPHNFIAPNFSFNSEPWKPIRRHATSEEELPPSIHRLGIAETVTNKAVHHNMTYSSHNPLSVHPPPVYKSFTNPSLSSNVRNTALLGTSEIMKHPIPVDKFSNETNSDTTDKAESLIALTNKNEDAGYESLQLEDRQGSIDMDETEDFVEIETLKYVPGSTSSTGDSEVENIPHKSSTWQFVNGTNTYTHNKTENKPPKVYNETLQATVVTDSNDISNPYPKNSSTQTIQNISTIFHTLASKLQMNTSLNTSSYSKDKNQDISFDGIEDTMDEPVVGHGLVEVINSSMQELLMTRTEVSTKLPLVTLIPVKSNSGMRNPLRPRPKMSEREIRTEENEESRSFSHSLFKNLIVLNKQEELKSTVSTGADDMSLVNHETLPENDDNLTTENLIFPENLPEPVVNHSSENLQKTNTSSVLDTEVNKMKIDSSNVRKNEASNSSFNPLEESQISKNFEDASPQTPVEEIKFTPQPPRLEFATSISSEVNHIKVKISDYIRSNLEKSKESNNTKGNFVNIMDFLISHNQTVDSTTTSKTYKPATVKPTVVVNVYSSVTNTTNRRNHSDILEADKLKKLAEISTLYHGNITGVGEPVISTKAVSSSYSINQAGLKILTKTFNKIPTTFKKDEVKISPTLNSIPLSVFASNGTECNDLKVKCGDGTCLPQTTRCNQLMDCTDGSDERNCTCADYLRSQFLLRKICDGVVDCWDFSDENNCEWCSQGQYVCLNSRMCIDKEKICDGIRDCPNGDDERQCVTVAPDPKAADEFPYNSKGYLMIRKYGSWGKLCTENFESVVAQSQASWQISDLGRAVCKAMTYKDLEYIERITDGPQNKSSFFELTYSYQTASKSNLSFQKCECNNQEVVKVKCRDLECGTRPETTNHWASPKSYMVPRMWVDGGRCMTVNRFSSRQSRIVGGTNANLGSWPWQAALYKEGDFQCGATLISDTWLISAGHCFYQAQGEYWVARLGALRRGATFPSPYEQIRPITKIILHPNYVNAGFINDIAILRMDSAVTFSDYVRPICLPSANSVLRNGRICTVVGWGQLFEVGRIFPDTLQEVQLPVISAADCRKKTLFLPLYLVTDDMFCAGYERGGRDACLGDSGGPLMCQENDNRWSLYGVTSNGFGCARASLPGVYTKVANYVEWINSHLNGSIPHNTTESNHFCRGHRCPLGECLPRSRICNGYIECNDGSDEKDCFPT